MLGDEKPGRAVPGLHIVGSLERECLRPSQKAGEEEGKALQHAPRSARCYSTCEGMLPTMDCEHMQMRLFRQPTPYPRILLLTLSRSLAAPKLFGIGMHGDFADDSKRSRQFKTLCLNSCLENAIA